MVKSKEQKEAEVLQQFEEIADNVCELVTDVRCSEPEYIEGLRVVITQLQTLMDDAVAGLDSGV